MTKYTLLNTIGVALSSALLSLSFSSCDKRDNASGISVIPDYTKLTAERTNLPLSYSSISAGSLGGRLTSETTEDGMTLNNVFVNSSYAYLGSIPNEDYGEVKSEYISQLYVPSGFKFAQEVKDNRIDSLFITLYYNSYTGDGKQPMQVKAFRIKHPLPDGDHYSIGDISKYIDDAELLGEVSYIASSGNSSAGENMSTIRIPLSRSLGQELYDKSKSGDPVFASQAAFDRYFSGIYFSNGAGKGSILRISRTALTFYFQTKNPRYTQENASKETPEWITTIQELSHTNEVPQASRYGNYDLEKITGSAEALGGYAYVKAPAGVFTEVTIPTTRLVSLLKEEPGYVKELNAAPLTIVGEGDKDSDYLLSAPQNLILLPRDSVQRFFEKEYTELNTRMTAYVSATTIHGSATYSFGNIAPLLLEHLKAKPGEDLRVVLIPIERTVRNSQPYGGVSGPAEISSSVSNQILPAAVRFATKGEINKELPIVITKRKEGAGF